MKRITNILGSALALGIVLTTAAALGPQGEKTAEKANANAAQGKEQAGDEEIIAAQKPSYPLKQCPVSNKPLDDRALDVVVDARLVRVCSAECAKTVKADPAQVLAQIDAAVIAAQKAGYPLEVCVISGEELGSMGEPVDYVYGTRLVRFCCKSCVKSFEKAPDKQLARVDAALIKKQKATYPLQVCAVSGEPLGDGAVDYLYGVTLVRLCCKDCTKAVKKNPDAVLAKLASKENAPKKEEKGG